MAHQYYPPSVHIPNFIPNTQPVFELLPTLGGLSTGVILVALTFARRSNPQLRFIDGFAVSWFALCK